MVHSFLIRDEREVKEGAREKNSRLSLPLALSV